MSEISGPMLYSMLFFFSSRRRHTRFDCDWSSDVCSSDLQAYRRQVTEAAQGPVRLYVEVHGNMRPESAGRMEIATVGVSRDDAWRLKALLEMIRDVRLPAEGEVPRLDVWMEPYDSLWYTASAAKQSGILAQTQLALHIELPRAARTTYREAYTTVLADFLIQSATLLLPPTR